MKKTIIYIVAVIAAAVVIALSATALINFLDKDEETTRLAAFFSPFRGEILVECDVTIDGRTVRYTVAQREDEVYNRSKQTVSVYDDTEIMTTRIQKDGMLYTLYEDELHYIVEASDDSVLRVLPPDLTGGYTTWGVTFAGHSCDRETYVYAGGEIRYYFSEDVLVGYVVDNGYGEQTVVVFVSVSEEADENLFELPEGYTELIR